MLHLSGSRLYIVLRGDTSAAKRSSTAQAASHRLKVTRIMSAMGNLLLASVPNAPYLRSSIPLTFISCTNVSQNGVCLKQMATDLIPTPKIQLKIHSVQESPLYFASLSRCSSPFHSTSRRLSGPRGGLRSARSAATPHGPGTPSHGKGPSNHRAGLSSLAHLT